MKEKHFVMRFRQSFVCSSLIYLVGPTGGVESICPTDKQRVLVLLQQDLDEIVTLVLPRQRKQR